jgi:hypothetical protein
MLGLVQEILYQNIFTGKQDQLSSLTHLELIEILSKDFKLFSDLFFRFILGKHKTHKMPTINNFFIDLDELFNRRNCSLRLSVSLYLITCMSSPIGIISRTYQWLKFSLYWAFSSFWEVSYRQNSNQHQTIYRFS